MCSKATAKFTIAIIGWAFFLSLCAGLTGAMAQDGECPDDSEFTSEFRLETCWFQTVGINPYLILLPGYRAVLETDDDAEDREKSVETVLWDTKWVHVGGRWIKTRVLEERAYEWDDDEEEWVNVEISRNYLAICKKTNAVYYFGEFSRDCEDGFDVNDVCTGREDISGSWEAGVDGARPGLIMPGTPLIGARYSQENAPPDARDRGEIVDVGFDFSLPVGSWSQCIEIIDTNPAENECGDDDAKVYCPGVGIVQDQDLNLIWNGFVDLDRWHWR